MSKTKKKGDLQKAPKSFKQSKVLKNGYGTIENLRKEDLKNIVILLNRMEDSLSIIEKHYGYEDKLHQLAQA